MTPPAFAEAVRIGAVVFVASLLAWQAGDVGWSQVVGDEAEMDRLNSKAEEAMANDDPEGAAMSMGRAALMAKNLARKHRDDGAAARLFQGAESLFRSQEHGYRAMALFRRAGGQLPASSGVCGSLSLAHQSVQHALSSLPQQREVTSARAEKAGQFRQTADNWNTVIDSMIADYQCR
jgi:hypothetical protein